ncbi:retrotransposon protein, putative, ty1-copia subclass [Tanacetum coccineum]
MGNNIPILQDVKSYLGRCFAMKDLGEATYILGIKIYRDRSRRLIGLCQSAYIEKILKRFFMENSKRGRIPMQEKLKLSKSQGASTPAEVKHVQNVPYASAMGSIMYAVRCTRLDVAFAQNITSRFQQNPCELHWTAVKNILKYLRNIKDMFLIYGGDIKQELRVSCYIDAGYLTDADDLKLQTGYVFVLNGGAVDWKSTKQSIFATSSAEAKYIATSDAFKEAVWVRKFISGLGVVPTIKEPIKMYCDNTGAITIANELGITKGARHYCAKVHYLRKVIEFGDVKIEKVHTDDNLADPFTKALAFPKHSKHTKNIGMLPASNLIPLLQLPSGSCWNVVVGSACYAIRDRLLEVIDEVVSFEQPGFIKGRQILDGLSRTYVVSAMRKHIEESTLRSTTGETKWNNTLPIKVNIFAWRLALDRLPTRFNLNSRRVDLDLMCGAGSMYHSSGQGCTYSKGDTASYIEDTIVINHWKAYFNLIHFRELGIEQERKIAWVKWDVVVNSKDNGELGIRSLNAFSLALLYNIGTIFEETDLSMAFGLGTGIGLCGMEDSWVWKLSINGGYSVKCARQIIDNSLLATSQQISRWCSIVPAKVNIMCWRAIQNMLPTRNQLAVKDINIPLVLCPSYMSTVKDIHHVIFKCDVAVEVSKKVATWLDLQILAIDDNPMLLDWVEDSI